MKRKNSKLFKAMMLTAMAMMIMGAHRASATESVIYKCANPHVEKVLLASSFQRTMLERVAN